MDRYCEINWIIKHECVNLHFDDYCFLFLVSSMVSFHICHCNKSAVSAESMAQVF